MNALAIALIMFTINYRGPNFSKFTTDNYDPFHFPVCNIFNNINDKFGFSSVNFEELAKVMKRIKLASIKRLLTFLPRTSSADTVVVRSDSSRSRGIVFLDLRAVNRRSTQVERNTWQFGNYTPRRKYTHC